MTDNDDRTGPAPANEQSGAAKMFGDFAPGLVSSLSHNGITSDSRALRFSRARASASSACGDPGAASPDCR
jgi:hypothetical protein